MNGNFVQERSKSLPTFALGRVGPGREVIIMNPILSTAMPIAILSALAVAPAARADVRDVNGPSVGKAHAGGTGFVYVMTNDPSGNSAVQFSRGSDGTLTKVSEVPTGGSGGTGNGVGNLDPLGSQDSLVLSAGSVLVAVNAGSNEVSALSAGATGLRLLNTIPSGGSFPNSVALRDNLVYVLNAHGVPNVSGFRLGPAGLAPIANSTHPLPGGSAAVPHDVRFSPDGLRLLVSEEGTNQIDIFEVGSSGLITGVFTERSAGSGPFGMRFARSAVLLNAEANSASVSSYELTADDRLTDISGAVADGQAATCWISVTGDTKFAFVSNTGAGNLSSYHVSQNGTLDLEQAVAATAAGGAPIDSAFSADSAFLYVVDSALGRILIYGAHGASLALIGTVGSLPTTVQGIAAQ
jgi:6-phosphogluconolactonase (cycloisomerase 2 family)